MVYITIKKLERHDTVSLKMQSHSQWEVPHIGVCVPPSSSCPTTLIPISCIRSSCVCISFSDVKECIYLAIIVNLYKKIRIYACTYCTYVYNVYTLIYMI